MQDRRRPSCACAFTYTCSRRPVSKVVDTQGVCVQNLARISMNMHAPVVHTCLYLFLYMHIFISMYKFGICMYE